VISVLVVFLFSPVYVLFGIAENVRATPLALSGDESLLIVRVSHSEPLLDSDQSSSSSSTVISELLVVDVLSAQLLRTVGSPLRGVAPASAEFVKNSDDILLVTYDVLSQNVTTGNHSSVLLVCCI